MKINNNTIEAKNFAFDGCHKIYLIEDETDLNEAIANEYEIYPISKLKSAYENSCGLRFIRNWKLDNLIAAQCEDAIFS